MHTKLDGRTAAFAVLLLAAALVPLAPAAADQPAAPAAGSDSTPTTGVVAYYFHGNVRCATCRKLEAYSAEAIEGGFPDLLAGGRLAWRVVNTDEPAYAHFVDDFGLVTKSLVLVEYRDGEAVRFKNLALVWQLVRDKDGFLKYVRDATRDFLAAS